MPLVWPLFNIVSSVPPVFVFHLTSESSPISKQNFLRLSLWLFKKENSFLVFTLKRMQAKNPVGTEAKIFAKS